MTLTGSEFERISEWMTGEVPADAGARQSPRVGVQAKVSMVRFAKEGSQASNVKVRDISTSGIGLLFHEQLKLDEEFVVLLPRYGQALPVMCSVVYWEPLAAGLFGIGAKFQRVLSSADEPHESKPPMKIGRDGPITRLVHALERKLRAAS